jgi:hypothetical protein
LGQAVRTQLVDGLLADLLQDLTFLRGAASVEKLIFYSTNKKKTLTNIPQSGH